MERKSGILFLVRVCSVEVFLYSMTGCLTLCFSHVFSHDGGYPIQLDSDTDTSCFFLFSATFENPTIIRLSSHLSADQQTGPTDRFPIRTLQTKPSIHSD